MIQECRVLMDGDRDAVFSLWKADKACSDATIKVKDFVYKPLLQRAIKRGVQIMPDLSDVKLQDVPQKKGEKDQIGETKRQAFAKWWEDVRTRTGWEAESDTIFSALEYWRECPKVDGALFVKIPVVDGKATPVRMDAVGARFIPQPKSNKRIKGYKFSYQVLDESGEGEGEHIEERITADEWTVNGTPQTMMTKGKFIPATHLVCEPQAEHPMGISLVHRCKDAFLDYLSTATDIRYGNKFAAHQIIVAVNNTGPAISRNPGDVVEISNDVPGVTPDLKAVGGGVTLESLFNELDTCEKNLYELAHAPWVPKEQGNVGQQASGRALDRLSADQQDYAEQQIIKEKAFLKDLLYKMAILEGLEIEREWLVIEHGDLVLPDKDVQIQEAEARHSMGDIRGAFLALGDDPDTVDQKVKAAEDKSAAEMAGRGTATGEAEEEEVEDDEDRLDDEA
jgi:hypothetical protein